MGRSGLSQRPILWLISLWVQWNGWRAFRVVANLPPLHQLLLKCHEMVGLSSPNCHPNSSSAPRGSEPLGVDAHAAISCSESRCVMGV